MPLLPAARNTDATAHAGGSTIIGPGAANTEVESLASTRIRDQNDCTQIPHVTNPVVWGSETVLIEGLFASRKTDQSLCGAEISGGAANVEIGGPTLQFHMHKGWLPGSPAGNTMVAVSPDSKTVYILSFLEYSGPGADAKYAANAEAQIEAMWGGKTMIINGEVYTVNVDVQTRVRADGDPQTPGWDQINVNSNVDRSNQMLYGDGWGNQNPNDANPGGNVIAAHEYGHTLGLEDEYHDEWVYKPGAWLPEFGDDWWPDAVSVPNDPTKTDNIMSSVSPTAHPHPDHYDQILDNYDLP